MIAPLLVLYAVAIAVWLLGRALFGDRLLVLGALNSFPTVPFVFVPVALLLAALDRRPVSVVAALIPAVLWLSIFGWRFLPRQSTVQAAGTAVRVMAFNVLYTNEDVEAIAAAIANASPDVVALPELTIEQDAALADMIGSSYPYRTLRRLPNSWFGVGIYSRWPLRDLGSLQTGLGLRSAVADVEAPGGVIRVVGAHPRATLLSRTSLQQMIDRLRQSFRGREAQLQAICGYLDQWASEGDPPVVLAGDFNMGEFSDAYRCIAKRTTDAYKTVGRGYGFTWPGHGFGSGGLGKLFFQTRIDYVFYSHHWRALSAEVVQTQNGSDHKAVVTNLVLAN